MGVGFEIGSWVIVLGIADWLLLSPLRLEDDIRQVFRIKPIQDAGDTLKYEQITN